MKVSLEELRDLEKVGLITIRGDHPDHPELRIANYTNKCVYGKHWTPTTKVCRGLIFNNETGDVVAHPVRKFFNLSELESVGESLPKDEQFRVYEKVDGSFGIGYRYKGQWYMATRGSFNSEQAVKGQEMLRKLSIGMELNDYTLWFEIVYPENKIVVDYGDTETLVMLGAYDLKSSHDFVTYETIATQIGATMCLTHEPNEMPESFEDNTEGYVLRYLNGFRVKIKSDEYVRLHRIKYGLSTVSVWEALASGQSPDAVLAEIPEEMRDNVEDHVRSLHYEYLLLMNKAFGIFYTTKGSTRKELALQYLDAIKGTKLPTMSLFALLDRNLHESSRAIWTAIKPDWKQL